MAIYAAFTCKQKTEILEVSGALYEKVKRLSAYLRRPMCEIFGLACANYGVSVEAVEKYLANDMKEEMKIADNFEL